MTAADNEEILAAQRTLSCHPVFSSIETMDQLRQFMEWHVFAVWDFMSLLKRLQRDLTCMTVPWTPPAHPVAARLINDIVLEEETDQSPVEGQHLSHFALYLGAMEEVGASTQRIRQFIGLLQSGVAVTDALTQIKAEPPIVKFVTGTLDVALNGRLPDVLGYFLYGRESIIPDMYRRLLANWKIERSDAPTFVFYLDRHIDLDTERHAPAARSIIKDMVGNDPVGQAQMTKAALAAIALRSELWDGLRRQISGV